jgi:hypothetical protein
MDKFVANWLNAMQGLIEQELLAAQALKTFIHDGSLTGKMTATKLMMYRAPT